MKLKRFTLSLASLASLSLLVACSQRVQQPATHSQTQQTQQITKNIIPSKLIKEGYLKFEVNLK